MIEKFHEIMNKSFVSESSGCYINKEYIGGPETTIETNPFLIIKFMVELYEKNPFYIRYVKEIILNYYKGNKYRGGGGDRSYIILNKSFAEKIKISGYFKWIDPAWGDARAELKYDLSALEKMLYITNAFSLSMIQQKETIIKVKEVSKEEVKRIIQKEGFISAVGHQSTAQILSELLDIPIPFNRIQIKLNPGDIIIVFQILARIEEGKVLTKEEILSLPFKFFLIDLIGGE
jgi:hypothetical protein